MSKIYLHFVRFVNQMAAKNDAENFLRLTEHPEKRDLGEASVKKLFARAPFESFEEIVAIPGISQDMLDASIEAFSFNNNAASEVGNFTIESDFILDEPLLLVDQFYSAELSVVNPVAGAELIAVVDCINIFEGEPLPEISPTASFRYLYPEVNTEEIPFLVTLADSSVYEQLAIKSPLRHVFNIAIPPSLDVGSGVLILQWGEQLASDAMDFEITSEALTHVRNEFSENVFSKAELLIDGAVGLVSWHNPLPQGAAAFDGSSGELIVDFPEGDWLPFFAFEKASSFEQNKTLWTFVEINTGEMINYESTIWPDIKIPTGLTDKESGEVFYNDIGPEFGLLQNRQNGFFGLDILFQESAGSPAPEPLPKKKVTNGIGFLKKNKGCPEIRKIAILIQLYDEAKDEKATGRPNFDKVNSKAKNIMRDLGCKLIVEIAPKDFTKTNPFRIPQPKKFNSFKPIKDAIEHMISLQDDCCFELIIFISSHQNKSNYLLFKDKKTKAKVSLPILSKLIGKTIDDAVKALKLKGKCKPAAELIVHSCYSGRFGDGKFTDALKTGLTGITGSSASGETSKGTPGNYFFLEALAECIKKNPGKTYSEIFKCIVNGTKRRARVIGKKQTPQRKLPKK